MGKWIYKEIKYCIKCFLDLIYPRPETCCGCGRELRHYSSLMLCEGCVNKISFYNDRAEDIFKSNPNNNIAYDSFGIACDYEGLVRDMIHRIKYKDKRENAITIAGIMAARLTDKTLKFDCIVPVPISKKKMKKRGYNHIKLIAQELSGALHIPVFDCLERIKDTDPQVLFNRENRWYNVKGCFICNLSMIDKRTLLIDDIITTGATAHFCAEELKKAGAKSVTVYAFAKSNLK